MEVVRAAANTAAEGLAKEVLPAVAATAEGTMMVTLVVVLRVTDIALAMKVRATAVAVVQVAWRPLAGVPVSST